MKYIVFSILFFLIITAQAQDVKVISFSRAINIALENNITLEQAENLQISNQATKLANAISLGPTVSANASAYRLKGNQFIEQEGRVIMDAETDNLSGTLRADMVLFSGLRQQYRISSSNAVVESQNYTIKRTRQDVMRDVANQYLQVLLDQQLLNITRENLEMQKTQLEQINVMVELGSRAPVDEINQQAQVKLAEVRLLRAQNTLINDKMQLAQLLLINPAEEFVLTEPDWEPNSEYINEFATDEAIEKALANRGDFQASIYTEKASKFGLRIANSAFYPTLSTFFSTGSFYSNASTPEFSDQVDTNLRTFYGLSLNIPVFNGLQRYSNSVQARVQYLNAELQTKELKNRIKAQVILAEQNYKDAILNFRAAESSLEASELSYELEEERYDLGVTDLVQYAQANQSFVQAKSDYAQAYYTLAFQDLLLKYATGTLTPEDIPE